MAEALRLQLANERGLATVQSALFAMKIDGRVELLDLLYGTPVTGSEVTGTFTVRTEAPVPYKKITVTLKGEAEVRNETYSSTDVFLNESVVLKESSTPGSSDELDKGVHNFQFRFQIGKENLPPSQITRLVFIKYSLEAHLHKGLPVIREQLPYAGTFNIDSEELAQSVSAAKEKKLFFASEPIRLFVELERSYVQVGRMVIMRVNVENNSGRSLSVKASIKGRAYTTVRTPNYYSKTLWAPFNTVAKVNREERIAPHTTIDWEPEGLIFPQTEPTTMELSSIRVTHLLRVRVGIPMSGYCVVDIPITVV